MKANVGNADRIIRIAIGIALIAAAASGQVGIWGWIGIVPLATGIFRFCPAYRLFGANTCGIKK